MYGLIDLYGKIKFELVSVSVDCKVTNLLVVCSCSFVYNNCTNDNTEALFSFPLNGSCVVYSFEAVIGGQTIVGVCKEIEEARNMYKAAKEAGHKAIMIERNYSMTDLFKCRIGNMPKHSRAIITLKFAMELTLSLDQSDCDDVNRFNLCLPLILRPRYTPAAYVGDFEVYHVTNKYDYKFCATITGTKKIHHVFSNNYSLNLKFIDDKKLSVQVILESEFDGTHDLDINIDYVKMRVPSVIYGYGSSSDHFKGKVANGAFCHNDVAMLNFLPEFNKKLGRTKKIEVVFVVDRSGSMTGSNIQHAKECLLIFLKSLPTICKFQIYGFGSLFDKVFPRPCLYDDQSIDIAMNYQRNIEANLGGTELMNPLQDIYQSELDNDYNRLVFLLTDGDVGNQDEIFKLVRDHNKTTRLFTVGIGDGVSTSLVQKVAESGLGKAVFVRNTKTLSANVIELLDIALNCHQFTDCKIEWKGPSHVTVNTVPSTIGPIFSNYFLTVFCMIHGMRDTDSLKFTVSGKVNGSSIEMTLVVHNANGISDDEFRIHRLLAKYKIDEMTAQIEDGKYDLKKSLIELSLAANIVTNYTTFVGIDPTVPSKGLMVIEEERYEMDCCLMPLCDGGFDECDGGFDEVDGGFDEVDGVLEEAQCERESCDIAHYDGCDDKMCVEVVGSKALREETDIVLFLADKQKICGAWIFDRAILVRMGLNITTINNEKPENMSDDVWMTAIVYVYLLEKLSNREKEWRLFARKAREWTEKNINNGSIHEQLIAKCRQMIQS